MRPHSPLLRCLCLMSAVLLTACESHFAVDLTVSTPDAVKTAQIAVTTIELLDSDGGVTSIDVDDSGEFDLTDYLDDNARRLLDADGELSSTYIGLRLRFNDSNAYVLDKDGVAAPIALLSSGEFADIDLELGEGQSRLYKVQLDLPFSLIDQVDALQTWQMIPVIRVVDADEAASISGTLPTDEIGDSDCREGRATGAGVAVYLFPGSDVTPADYYSGSLAANQVLPVGYAKAAYDGDTARWTYRFGAVSPGDYTVAWTCVADTDNPVQAEDLAFRASRNLSVEALATAVADF